jgi:hypothetical protein
LLLWQQRTSFWIKTQRNKGDEIMFCVYCKNPFDENSKMRFCAGCGKELFRGDCRVQKPQKPKKPQEHPQTTPPFGLTHTCARCGAEFPVVCTYCREQVSDADTIIPPEGWLVCESCNQSFWVICSHCRIDVKGQEHPPAEQPQPEPQGQAGQGGVRGSFGNLGRSDAPYASYTPEPQTPRTRQTPRSGGSGEKTAKSTQQKTARVRTGGKIRASWRKRPVFWIIPILAIVVAGFIWRPKPTFQSDRDWDWTPPSSSPSSSSGSESGSNSEGASSEGVNSGRNGAGGASNGDSSPAAYFTPNATYGSNAGASVQMYGDYTYIVWGANFVTINNATGKSETFDFDNSSTRAEDEPQIYTNTTDPVYFVGDYAFLRITEKYAAWSYLLRMNLKTKEIVFDYETKIYDLLYDGEYLYVVMMKGEVPGSTYFIEKVDPGTMEILQTYDIPKQDDYLGYNDDNALVWQGKYYYRQHIRGSGYGQVSMDVYIVVDLETGQSSRFIDDPAVKADRLCANENALYYLTGGEYSLPHEKEIYSYRNGRHSVFFNIDTIREFGYELEPSDYNYQKDISYVRGIDKMFLDGDWMYIEFEVVFLDKNGDIDSEWHMLKVKTDGSSIHRLHFGGRGPRHNFAVSGQWLVENGLRWQFKDGELVADANGPLSTSIPIQVLK